jgi:hypothetical protein
MIWSVENPAIRLHTVSHATPATYTGYPPYMSAKRPNINRKEATTRENALAGHVADAAGISRLVVSVGRITVKPDTKYSWK